jgi:hypothetical protein
MIKADQFLGFVRRKLKIILERRSFKTPTTFAGLVPPSVVHQDLAHQSTGDCKKMKAIFPMRLSAFRHPKKRLIDKGGGLKCVVPPFPVQTDQRHSAKLRIYQTNNPGFSLAVAGPETV